VPRVGNDRVFENINEARAGVIGHNVRQVLLISLIMVIALFAVTLIVTI